MITLIQQGGIVGIVMWMILAAGIMALVVFLERLFHVHRAQIKSDDFVRGICNIVGRRNIKEALSICDETPGPVARIVRAAIQHRGQDRRLIVQAVDDAAVTEIARMERRFGVLATVAQLAPLLGLLGTVLGMIQTAMEIEQKTPLIQAGDLAGGIWLALITTAAGLCVAILSYAGYNLLVTKVDGIVLDMERSAGEILGFFTSSALFSSDASSH
ncbi:MAG: MotA/TolQ/ExbB proton channel family protein [Verrucomicrobia bacterium]|nr:MotA/TolQ/ExbB proton channel family protein [Verrucomicrobiota bacterium]MBU4290457.1 MotA/TolQ/ExbB proton channel family protein [Verrucomicrobiota bacterium]MBU4430059.1 MotA/TolQ/ExbB proton channel family protein [Verrucomicrobiota bacterium]MCG2681114.1 MotA/TolQ/ExbB proton channel family protein [Kiritimatiellia bacterium]